MSPRIVPRQHRAVRQTFAAALLLFPFMTGCSDGSPSSPPPDEVGAPVSVVIVAGNQQSGEPGVMLPDSLRVRVLDAAGRGVSGVAVTWSVAAGGGVLSPASVTTDATGHARASWTLGPAEAAQEVKATVAALPPVTFTATGAIRTGGTGTVTPQGGVIGLPDGTRVVFPAGAVSGALQATVARLDAAPYVAAGSAGDRTVVSVTASVSTFSAPVEIRVPLPAGMTAADSGAVRVGLIDETTGALTTERASVRVIDGTPYAVVAVTHFSKRLFEWLIGSQPPASAGPLVVPYYNQGESEYCWATSLQMLTQAVRPADEGTIPDIIGAVGVDEGGITSGAFRFGSAIADIVRQRTGQSPRRQTWDYMNVGVMASYLREEIGLNGRPVALFNGVWEHAVVVLGYSGNTYYIHDPASTAAGGVGYTAKTWTEIAAGMSPLYNMVTMAIPAALGAGDSPIRINFLPRSVEFLKPSLEPEDPSAIWNYRWDHTVRQGYSLRHMSTGEMASLLPGRLTRVSVPGDIQISNAARGGSRQLSVWTEIIPLGAPAGYTYAVQQDVTLAANSVTRLKLDPVNVDTFRYNQKGPTTYAFTVRVLADGVLDWKSFYFQVDSVTPELQRVTPAAAAVGDTVRLRGSYFGLVKERGEVTFNGVKATVIESWANDEILVKVPAGARTGKLIVKHGEVPSKGVDFTVLETTTVSEGISFSDPDALTKASMVLSGSWSFTAEGAKLSHSADAFYSLRSKINVPAVLDVELQPAVEPAAVTVVNADSSYTEYYYRPSIVMNVARTGDFAVASAQQGAGSHRYEFTMTSYSQSLTIEVWFQVHADIISFRKDGTESGRFTDVYVNQRTPRIFYFRAE